MSESDILNFIKNGKNKVAELKANKTISEEKAQKLIKVIEKIKTVSVIASILRDTYVNYKNNESKLDALSNQIVNIDNNIELLKIHQDNIYNFVLPLIGNVRDNVNSLVHSLNSKSQAGLIESQWEMQNYLRDIQLKMQKISQGFKAQESLVQCIEELNNTLTSMISIYDTVQVYQGQKMLADYIVNIQHSNPIVIRNEEYKDALIDLEFSIKSNIIFNQYERAVNAITQCIFPFADYYFADFILPEHLQLNKDIDSLVPGVINHVENLQAKLIESRITIDKYDPHICIGYFNNKNKNTGAFFTWKNSDYRNIIKKLLAGEELLVKADITKSNEYFNAVKFNEIVINFKTANQTMQSELDKELENFAVSLTHLGNSYYRWNNEFYLIVSDKQLIKYTFARNSKGELINKNLVYEKLKNSHFMLSPYTMWNIQLTSIANKNFDVLHKYGKYVDLELVGYGQYISKDINVCTNLQVEKYYNQILIEFDPNDFNV